MGKHQGCKKFAKKGGVCQSHGAERKRCSHEGCDNQSRKGGVCITHGAEVKRCSYEGCTNQARNGGVCVIHGAEVKRCSHVGCNKHVVKGGVCITHGAKVTRKLCSVVDCKNQSRKGGVCVTHGAKRKRCSVVGCANGAVKGGVCVTHGARSSLPNTANPPSKSRRTANDKSDDTPTEEDMEGEEENHGNVGDRGGDKATPFKPLTKRKKEPKRVKPIKKSHAAKTKLPKQINKKKTVNAKGAMTEEVNKPTKHTTNNNKPPSAPLPNTIMHPVLPQGDGNEMESDEPSAAQADKTEDYNTTNDNDVFPDEESDNEVNMDDPIDDDANEGNNQEDATEDVKEDDVICKTTKSTTAAASDLPVGVENQAKSAQPPQPQELSTCNNERCNENVFRGGFCMEHLLAETNKKLEAVTKEFDEYKKMAEDKFAEFQMSASEAKARAAYDRKEIEIYKNRATAAETRATEAETRAEARAADDGKKIEDCKKWARNTIDKYKKRATEYAMKLAEATKTVGEYKKRATEADARAKEAETRAEEAEMKLVEAEMKLVEADARATAADARASAGETRTKEDNKKLTKAAKTIETCKKRAAEDKTNLAEAKRLIITLCGKLNRHHSNDNYHESSGARQDDADAEKAQLRSQISEAIGTDVENVTWEDVVGLKGAKESLHQTVIMPVEQPQLFTGKRKPYKGILLYGPPGTGKSHLAKAVATKAGYTFFSVSSSNLISMWQGQSEKLVRTLFEMARESPGGQAVIFIDEIDSLCRIRKVGEDDSVRRVKTEFLLQMEGVVKTGNVLVLGATNVPWELDPAIRSRFEKRLFIPLPEAEARCAMLKMHLGDTPNNLSDADFKKLGQMMVGASGRDIKVLVKKALMEPLRTCQQATQFKRVQHGFYVPCEYPCDYCLPELLSDTPGAKNVCTKCRAIRMQFGNVPPGKLKAPDVGVKDFEKLIRQSHKSVSDFEMKKYTKWTKNYGNDGV